MLILFHCCSNTSALDILYLRISCYHSGNYHLMLDPVKANVVETMFHIVKFRDIDEHCLVKFLLLPRI